MSEEKRVSVPVSLISALVDDIDSLIEESELKNETTDEPPYQEGEHTVYVLELENRNYYVGTTSRNCWMSIKKHFDGKGSAWTKKHSPVDIIEVIPNVRRSVARTKTLELMEEKGWESVRGWGWSRSDMSGPPKELRENP